MLIDCPECGQKVSDQAGSCPRCGHPIAAAVAKPAAVKTYTGVVDHQCFATPRS